MQEDKKNKSKFITLLKQYLNDRKGPTLYEQIQMQLSPSIFINDSKEKAKSCFSGYKKAQQTDETDVNVSLEIDLMDMIIYDPFLGENFIKCLFRYYCLLPQYTKEIFIEQLIAYNGRNNEMLDKIENQVHIKLNLKL